MDKYTEDYLGVRPIYEKFRVKLEDLLSDLFNESSIEIASIEGRTKSIESFSEKIKRQDKNYKDPLNEITDLCGIRIITYYTEDIYKIASLIEKELKVDPKNSIDKTRIENPDTFGYQSLHYVVNLNSKRNKLAEWKNFNSLKAEIQVRSILQHSWAAIDHKLRYKSKVEIPSRIKRKIYRLSALLELADEEFLSIKNETQKLSSEIEISLDQGNLEIEVNIISLSSYLETSEIITDLRKHALKIGFIEETMSKDDDYDDFFYGRLLKVIKLSNVKSIKDIDTIVRNRNALKHLEKFITNFKQTGSEFFAIPADLINILIIMSGKYKGSNEELEKIIMWPPMTETLATLS